MGFQLDLHVTRAPMYEHMEHAKNCQLTSRWLFYFLLLHRANESQKAGNSYPRLQFDSRFGLYRVAVELSFLRSQISLTVISVTYEKGTPFWGEPSVSPANGSQNVKFSFK